MENNQASTLARIESAAMDGRMRVLKIRQQQLRSLYGYLCKHRGDFLDAVKADDRCLENEAQIAFASALIELRNHYDALNLDTDLAQEYSLARGESNENRRIAITTTYIIPDNRSLIFGVLSALYGAIEAGSCCIVELENTVRKSSAFLRQVFYDALDKDAYGVISSRAPSAYLSRCIIVDQTHQSKPASGISPQRILTSSVRQNIVIADRTADVELVAKEVVASKLAFGGCSRYAVDLVLVNEYKAEALIQALTKALEEYQKEHIQDGSRKQGPHPSTAFKLEGDISVDEEVKHGRAQFIQGNAQVGVLELLDRTSALSRYKSAGQIIMINRFTSLDDPIDFLNETGQQPAVGALYMFAANREAKYMSQYISSQATFSNHIPAQLLVGPIAPHGYTVNLRTRYSRDMFEYPSPEIIKGPRSHLSSTILSGPAKSSWLVSVAEKPLKPTGQKPAGAWGFFEQGMIVGALVYLLPIVGISLLGVGYTGFQGYRRIIGS